MLKLRKLFLVLVACCCTYCVTFVAAMDNPKPGEEKNEEEEKEKEEEKKEEEKKEEEKKVEEEKKEEDKPKETVLENLRKENEELKIQFNALKLKSDQVNKELETAKEKIEKQVAELQTLNDGYSKKETELENLNNDYVKQKEDYNKLNDDYNKLNDDYNKLNDGYNKLNDGYNKLNDGYNKQTEDLKNAQNTIEEQKNQLEDQENAVNDVKKELNVTKSKLGNAENQIVIRNTQNEQLNIELANKNKTIKNKEMELSEKEKELHEQNIKRIKAELYLKKEEEKHKKTKNELDRYRGYMNNAKTVADKLDTNNEKEIKELLSTMKGLKYGNLGISKISEVMNVNFNKISETYNTLLYTNNMVKNFKKDIHGSDDPRKCLEIGESNGFMLTNGTLFQESNFHPTCFTLKNNFNKNNEVYPIQEIAIQQTKEALEKLNISNNYKYYINDNNNDNINDNDNMNDNVDDNIINTNNNTINNNIIDDNNNIINNNNNTNMNMNNNINIAMYRNKNNNIGNNMNMNVSANNPPIFSITKSGSMQSNSKVVQITESMSKMFYKHHENIEYISQEMEDIIGSYNPQIRDHCYYNHNNGHRSDKNVVNIDKFNAYYGIFLIYRQVLSFDVRMHIANSNNAFKGINELSIDANGRISSTDNDFITAKYKQHFYNIYHLFLKEAIMPIFDELVKMDNDEFKTKVIIYFTNILDLPILSSNNMVLFFKDADQIYDYFFNLIKQKHLKLLSRQQQFKVSDLKLNIKATLDNDIRNLLFYEAYAIATLINSIGMCSEKGYQINDDLYLYSYSTEYLFNIPLRLCISKVFNDIYSLHIIGYNAFPLFLGVTLKIFYNIQKMRYISKFKEDYDNTKWGCFLNYLSNGLMLNAIQLFTINIKIINNLYFSFNFMPVVCHYLSYFFNNWLSKHKIWDNKILQQNESTKMTVHGHTITQYEEDKSKYFENITNAIYRDTIEFFDAQNEFNDLLNNQNYNKKNKCKEGQKNMKKRIRERLTNVCEDIFQTIQKKENNIANGMDMSTQNIDKDINCNKKLIILNKNNNNSSNKITTTTNNNISNTDNNTSYS